MDHKCSTCGKVHTAIPANARPQMDLDNKEVIAYFWECECLSTMCKVVKTLRGAL